MLIREHPAKIIDGDGTYIARICGQERADGTWEAWLEFHPTNTGQPILRTDQETSQPNRVALEYWADGLEPIYLEGALARAQGGCCSQLTNLRSPSRDTEARDSRNCFRIARDPGTLVHRMEGACHH